jgi:hypothetical protein
MEILEETHLAIKHRQIEGEKVSFRLFFHEDSFSCITAEITLHSTIFLHLQLVYDEGSYRIETYSDYTCSGNYTNAETAIQAFMYYVPLAKKELYRKVLYNAAREIRSFQQVMITDNS